MELIYHLVPKKYFESLDTQADYVPEAFGQDGFIHCTDAPDEMARVANLFYRLGGPHLYLYIDRARVKSPVRYDDPENRYSHIYGALNRDAIRAIREVRYDAEGNLEPPEDLENE